MDMRPEANVNRRCRIANLLPNVYCTKANRGYGMQNLGDGSSSRTGLSYLWRTSGELSSL
jgi:hypothetical protein